jgi:hypothetical protein
MSDRLDVHVYLHLDSGLSADPKLDAILAQLALILNQESTMSAELDSLTAQVKANTDVEASALALINGIAARITAAGTDPAALAALTASLKSSDDDLAAAVLANTPAAPSA